MRARDNPFAVDRVLCQRFRLQGTDWPALLARLETLRFRVAIVGPEGSGKTTLLEDLAPHLAVRGFETRPLRLDLEKRRFRRNELREATEWLGPGIIILLDGADHLRPLAWHWLKWRFRRAGGLIVTSHCSGLLPTLIECRTSPELLAELASALLGTPLAATFALELHIRHAGNLRTALRELYDRCADGETLA